MAPAVPQLFPGFSGPPASTDASAHDPAEERRNPTDHATKALLGTRVCLMFLYIHYT